MSELHYNPRGYEAVLAPDRRSCTVVVRGVDIGGKTVERGGPAHPDDPILSRFRINSVEAAKPAPPPAPVRDTFIDSLCGRRDLLGVPEFRHKPESDAERRLFAAAYDAAQKILSKMTVLGCDKLFFALVPSLFAVVDCFARDAHGFWLMNAGEATPAPLLLAACILERGGYVPATASVRLGVWNFSQTGAAFAEIPNDRAAARDLIIDHLCETPF